jgi:hypothetical protein
MAAGCVGGVSALRQIQRHDIRLFLRALDEDVAAVWRPAEADCQPELADLGRATVSARDSLGARADRHSSRSTESRMSFLVSFKFHDRPIPFLAQPIVPFLCPQALECDVFWYEMLIRDIAEVPSKWRTRPWPFFEVRSRTSFATASLFRQTAFRTHES